MHSITSDLRFAFRTLLKRPAFTAIAVFTIALGIGANTAIFSVVHASLLKPLPYPEPREILIYWETNPNFGSMSISWPNYQDWRGEVTTLEEMAVYRRARSNLTGVDEPELVRSTMVSANLFDVVGLAPARGRVFGADEDRIGGPRVAVLTDGYWQRRFGGDPDIVGQTIRLDGEPFEVIGVMPEAFRHPTRSDLFIPITQFSDDESWQSRGNHPGIYGLARLSDGASLAEAQAEIDAISAALAEQYPDTNTGNGVEYRILPDYIVSNIKPALLLLTAAVGLVLLIACVNVANLLLARTAGRDRELAVRAAVGAGRWEIARQLLTESLLLALMGGALGIALAYLGVDALRAIYGSDLPRAEDVSINAPVLGFTALLAIGTGVLFGVMPALQGARRRMVNPLQTGARSGLTAERRRFQTGLAVTEIALAVVLLVGAGLLLRSFARVLNVDPGLDPENVLTASVNLPTDKYDTGEKINAFWDQVLDRIGSLPGVTDVGITNNLPFVGGNQTSYAIAGRPEPAPGEYPHAEYAEVSLDYFDAIGMRLLSGRLFTDTDRVDAPPVMVIDQAFAEKHWPGDDPIGQQVAFDSSHLEEKLQVTVVGVVATVRHNGLDVEPPRPQMYFPYVQRPDMDRWELVVKSETPPESLIEPIRRAVLAVDPEQPIYNARPYRAIVDESLADRRLSMSLFGFFAAVAVTLALIGIYGVVSYGVARRTQEIGVRMAMGADAGRIRHLVLRQVGVIALAGVGIGIVGALALSRFVESQLYEIGSHDPLTFMLVPAALLAFALGACLMPARRAASIQPTEALRYE